jgi:hypothetical protein
MTGGSSPPEAPDSSLPVTTLVPAPPKNCRSRRATAGSMDPPRSSEDYREDGEEDALAPAAVGDIAAGPSSPRSPGRISPLNPAALPFEGRREGSVADTPDWLRFSTSHWSMSSSSSEDGEASPCRLVASSKRKGKEIATEPAVVPHRAATGGFMADARRSGVPLAGEGRAPRSPSRPDQSPPLVAPRSASLVDTDGWEEVRRRRSRREDRPARPPPILCRRIWLVVASIAWRRATSPLLAGIPLAAFAAGGRAIARSSAGGAARRFLRLGPHSGSAGQVRAGA